MKVIENHNLEAKVKVHLEYISSTGKILKLVESLSTIFNRLGSQTKGNFYVLYGNVGTSDEDLQATVLKRTYFTRKNEFKAFSPITSLKLASEIFHREYVNNVEHLIFK